MYDVVTLAIRSINFVLWALVIFNILRRGRALSILARKAVCATILFGMLILTIGGLVPFGVLAGDSVRIIYTAFTVFAAIVALALLTTDDDDEIH